MNNRERAANMHSADWTQQADFMRPHFAVQAVKRAVDIAIGLVGSLAFFVAYPILAALIKLESRGPAVYTQQRVGLDRRGNHNRRAPEERKVHGERRGRNVGGGLFTIYKFRTMRLDAESNGPRLCDKGGDPRVTKVGRWLRALHLDELPQFWNILKGEMSFIGPRPERPHFTLQYGLKIPLYTKRTLLVKPGLTGLSQITLGYDDSLESVVRKTHFDLAYRATFTDFTAWMKAEAWILGNTCLYLLRRKPLGSAVALPVKASRNRENEAVPAGTRVPAGLAMAMVRYHDTLKPTWVLVRNQGDLARHFPEISTSLPGKQGLAGTRGRAGKLDVCMRPGRDMSLEDMDLMLQLAQRVRRTGGKVSVKSPSPAVGRLLRETRLDKFLQLQRPSGQVGNFLTIDVECWFHAHNLGIPKTAWDKLPTKVVENVRRILDLLKAHDAKATFFVLGWVADRFPEVVRMIDAGGHEIGTHGYMHDKVTEMSPYQFERDLEMSLNALYRHTSHRIVGHRASNFSIVESTYWALEILARNGIEYDSSIFPVDRKRYGVADYPNGMPHVIELPSGNTIREVPLSTMKVGSKAVPISGGGYLRLYPYALTDFFIRRRNLQGRPAMVYFHPWELDADQQRIKTGPLKSFQHYVNLDTTEWKIHRLLESFPFSSVQENLESRRMQALLARNPVRLSASRGMAKALESYPAKSLLGSKGLIPV